MAATGVYRRHRKGCRSKTGGRCNCRVSWQAQAFDQHTGKLVTRTFPTESAAKAWRHDAVTAIRSGKLRAGAPKAPTVSAALEDLLGRMEAGNALDRSGKPYKPARSVAPGKRLVGTSLRAPSEASA